MAKETRILPENVFGRAPQTFATLTVFCLMAAGVVVHARHRVPVFEGKDWGHWLREFNTIDDKRRAQARQAFHKMGEPLVPVLIRALERDDALLAKLNSKWGYRLPDVMRRWLPACGKAEKIHAQAAQALGVLGPDARQAVPALVRSSRDLAEDVSRASAEALGRIGPLARAAVPALTAMLASPASSLRVAAAQALGRIGPGARDAQPALVGNLKSAVPLVRATAATALGKLGDPAPLAVSPLIELTHDADDYVRTSALLALGKLGANEPKAIDALTVALRDTSPPVRICAVEALGEIGPLAKPAIPAMINAQLCDQSGLGRFVSVALNKIDPENHTIAIRE